MKTRLFALAAPLAVALIWLAAPAPAAAKGPTCTIDIHAVYFTRTVYAPGRWVSARLDADVHTWGGEPTVPGSPEWRRCLSEWSQHPLYFDRTRATGGSAHVEFWIGPDFNDIIIAGRLEPDQPEGEYELGLGYWGDNMSADAPVVFSVVVPPAAVLLRPPLPLIDLRGDVRTRWPVFE